MNALLFWWEHLRVVVAFIGLLAAVAVAVAILVWHARGLLVWKRSQRRELVELKRLHDAEEGVRRQALGEIIAACDAIRRSNSLDIDLFKDLPNYWRKIAACYYPEETKPELCLSVGRLMATAQQLADRVDGLLQRPGFDRLGRLRIRQLRLTYQWHQKLMGHPVIAWIMAKRQALGAFQHVLRFIFPDPLVWISYLSQRLAVMMALRCLLIDVYLYSGKSAMDAFDAQRASTAAAYGARTSNAVLEAYEAAMEKPSSPLPDELAGIRNNLVGLPGRLWRPPGAVEWYKAVEDAARAIASGYFPESAAPLDEATFRVLLDRGRFWLQEMAAARRMPVVRPLYRISLKRLYQIKTISETDLMRQAGKMAGGARTVWRWTRWPIKVLRWLRRPSPAGVAVDMSVTIALKAVQNFLARYGYDRACQELDLVYRHSKKVNQNIAADR